MLSLSCSYSTGTAPRFHPLARTVDAVPVRARIRLHAIARVFSRLPKRRKFRFSPSRLPSRRRWRILPSSWCPEPSATSERAPSAARKRPSSITIPSGPHSETSSRRMYLYVGGGFFRCPFANRTGRGEPVFAPSGAQCSATSGLPDRHQEDLVGRWISICPFALRPR